MQQKQMPQCLLQPYPGSDIPSLLQNLVTQTHSDTAWEGIILGLKYKREGSCGLSWRLATSILKCLHPLSLLLLKTRCHLKY